MYDVGVGYDGNGDDVYTGVGVDCVCDDDVVVYMCVVARVCDVVDGDGGYVGGGVVVPDMCT